MLFEVLLDERFDPSEVDRTDPLLGVLHRSIVLTTREDEPRDCDQPPTHEVSVSGGRSGVRKRVPVSASASVSVSAGASVSASASASVRVSVSVSARVSVSLKTVDT